MTSPRLRSLRRDLDRVDARLAPILTERAELVILISDEKEALGLPVRDPERERLAICGYPPGLSQDFAAAIVEASATWQGVHRSRVARPAPRPSPAPVGRCFYVLVVPALLALLAVAAALLGVGVEP